MGFRGLPADEEKAEDLAQRRLALLYNIHGEYPLLALADADRVTARELQKIENPRHR
jgi:hypothetical protein